MKRALVAVLGLLAAITGCRCGKSGPALTCTPRQSSATAPAPTDVRSVAIYWDVSQSMSAYAVHPSAMHALWQSLDAKWTRRSAQTIDTVEHFGVGATIHPLARLGGAPAATDGWTDLPRMGERIGQILAGRDDAAAVVVSDMLVDTPPLPVGTKLCGDVSVPAGRGDVPALVGKCLATGFGGPAPSDLVVTSVALLDPLGPRIAARPLFVTIFARNARFSAQLASVLNSELDTFTPASLPILKATPLVPCEHVTECRFRANPSLVSHDACSFTVTRASRRDLFPMACLLEPPDDSFEAGLLTVEHQTATRNGEDVATTERLGRRLVDLKLPIASAQHDLSAKVRWGLRDNAGVRIDQWLGGRYDGVADYRDLYRTMAAVLARQLPAPTCREAASLEFRGR